jgi:hypothetical protein
MTRKKPAARVSLSQVMNDSWMMEEHSDSGESTFPNRVPLHLPLDPEVIECMSRLEFGTAAEIEKELEQAIQSPEYQALVSAHASKGDSTTSEQSHTSLPDAYLARDTAKGAINPMISMYHLVCEKRERERANN